MQVVPKSSPASRRTAELPSRRKSNPVVPQEARHSSGMAKLIWTSLQHAWVFLETDRGMIKTSGVGRCMEWKRRSRLRLSVVLAHFGIPIQVLWISVARSLGHRDNEYSA
ncbi:MAG: hypothetical protein DMG61_02570 [Acidobacteria bacterium]|nr:MAG: hypothetical protein DMG61_02570 [Acidobacteriota bacterium]